jgi:GAF domain-containing protein
LKIVVGLWGATENLPDAGQRLRASGADEIVTTLAEALVQLGKFVPPLGEPLPAPLHADEEARLAALHELHLLDTEPEPVFDRFTAKLARIFDVQLALIMLVDRERQFIKSQAGAGATLAETRQIPRAALPCGYVIAGNETLVVDDLARDRRFAGSPLVLARGQRFYAGVPLHAPNGQPIGTLSILDAAPRQLTAREKRLLEEYAREVTEEISLRLPAPTSTAAA